MSKKNSKYFQYWKLLYKESLYDIYISRILNKIRISNKFNVNSNFTSFKPTTTNFKNALQNYCWLGDIGFNPIFLPMSYQHEGWVEQSEANNSIKKSENSVNSSTKSWVKTSACDEKRDQRRRYVDGHHQSRVKFDHF